MIGTLRIKDIGFDVMQAELMCFVDDDLGCLCWSLELSCVGGLLAGERVRPRAQCDRVLRTVDRLDDWRTLFPARVAVPDPEDPDADPAALLYVVEHMPMRRNVVQFDTPVGNECPLQWTGLGDVDLGDEYGENVPVAIQVRAPFIGAPVGRRSEDAGRRELEPFLDLSQFDFRVLKGVSTFVPK